MLNPDLLIPALDSPQSALLIFDTLSSIIGTHASSWRECARRLRAASAEVPNVFKAKYLDRALECVRNAERQEACGVRL